MKYDLEKRLLQVSHSLRLVKEGVQVWQQGVSHAQSASSSRSHVVPQVELLRGRSQSVVVTVTKSSPLFIAYICINTYGIYYHCQLQ